MTTTNHEELQVRLAAEAQALGIPVEALQNLRTKEAIFDNQFDLGLTLPRWLFFEKHLDKGGELDEATVQQHAEDLEALQGYATKLWVGTMPDVKNGCIYAVDILNPICNAWAYFIGAARKERLTHEEHFKVWDEELEWARNTKAVKMIERIFGLGATEEQQEVGGNYLKDRNDGHSILATVVKTMIMNWIHGGDHMESERFKHDFKNAQQVFASMGRVNDHWEDTFTGSIVAQAYYFYQAKHFKEFQPAEVNALAFDIVEKLRTQDVVEA